MIGFPFQSNYLGMDDYGNPIFDRAVNAEFYRQMQKLFYNNGVFANPSTNFQVIAHNGMTVRVKPGFCFVEGVTGIEINNTDITIDPAEELTDRTDSIVLRADFTHNRRLTVELKKSTTQLRRDSDVYELLLAQVRVRRLTTTILQSDITDTRYSDVCGVVTGILESVDTSTLFLQFQSYLEQKQAQWNEAGEQQQQAWREQMRMQASEHSAQQQRIEDWYNSVKANIALLQRFDFDNIADMAGAKRVTASLENGSVVETIVLSSNSRKIADRTSEFLSDGNIKQTTRVYIEDGITVGKTFTVMTVFLENGDIEEVVS